MRKFVLFLMIFALFVFSLGFSQQGSSTAQRKILTFEDALNIALQNNKDLYVAKISLQSALDDYEQKKKDPTTLILALTQAEKNAKLEQVKFNNTKLQIIQNVRNAYFSVLEAQAQLRLLEKQVNLYQEQLNAVKSKFQLGNATETDVMQAEINLLSAKNNYDLGVSNLKNAWSQFWQVLGTEPMDVELKEPEFVTFDFNLDQLFSIAQENLTTLVQAKNNVEIYELQVKLYDNDYTPKSQLKSAQDSLESAKVNLTQSLANAKLTISQRLDQLLNSLDKVNIQKKNLELAQKSFDIAKIRFNAGLITKIDLLNSEINLVKAENDYYSALHTYWKNIDSLSLSVGKEIYERGDK
ncbi:MAG: transporter [Dictyoglomus sp. NZ13-RE01]|nr:MAG: transporter [Dictyoglomus sp. NZ13-RE01]